MCYTIMNSHENQASHTHATEYVTMNDDNKALFKFDLQHSFSSASILRNS